MTVFSLFVPNNSPRVSRKAFYLLSFLLPAALLFLCPITALANGPIPSDGGQGGGIYAGLAIFIILALLLFAILGTTLIEFLCALPFRLKPVWWVLPVNFITNLLFNLFLIVFVVFGGLPYLIFVPLGEVFVILAEYLVYRRIYRSCPRKTIFCYVLFANLTSLFVFLVIWNLTS